MTETFIPACASEDRGAVPRELFFSLFCCYLSFLQNGYSVNIRLTLLRAKFFLALHVETCKLVLFSVCIIFVEVLDTAWTEVAWDDAHFLRGRLCNALCQICDQPVMTTQ